MAHPPSGCSVPTNVRESSVVISVRSTERNLLDGLVEDEASGVIVDDSEAIPANVKNRSDRLSFRVLKKN